MGSWIREKASGAPLLAVGLAALLFLGTACGQEKGGGEAGHGASPSPGASAAAPAGPPPVVLVSEVRREGMRGTAEWQAQTVAAESVDIKARVLGTLENFTFKEGAMVSAGQVLFTIDASEYLADAQAAQARVSKTNADLTYALAQVDLRKAKADLAAAQAQLVRAQQDVDRYTPLAANQVIPQQTLDNAVATRDVAKSQVEAQKAIVRNTELSDRANIEMARANVQAAEAEVTRAQLNVGYCTITSPITGIIGTLNVDPGNLVGQPGNTTPLATISRVDPMYVNFGISEAEYLQLIERRKARKKGEAEFRLLLADGTEYPEPGRFGTAERALSTETGTLTIRTIFPNPKGILRPGQFARLVATGADTQEAVLVPLRAITQVQSDQMVFIVDEGNKVAARTVVTSGTRGSDAIVTSGLQGGERVIVEGIQKVKPGIVCDPKPESSGSTTEATPGR